MLGEFFTVLFLAAIAGVFPTALVALLVWKLGPRALTVAGICVAFGATAACICLFGDPPFFTRLHMFLGAFVLAGGLWTTRLVWLEKHNAAVLLERFEPSVNKVLETQWHCIDAMGTGFVSWRTLRKLDWAMGEDADTEFSRVVRHLIGYFPDIAINVDGTKILTPAVAHKYIDGVRAKYRNWL